MAHLRLRRMLGELDRLIELRVCHQDVNHVRITFRLTRYAPDFAKRGVHGRLAAGRRHDRLRPWQGRSLGR